MLRSPALCVGGQLKTVLLAWIELCFISVALPSELETWTHSGSHLTQGEGRLGYFAIFLVIFRSCIWEEIVFLKRVVKFGEIRNT